MTYRVRALIVALVLLTALPAASQDRGERWVATWATALVARALPQPGGRGQGPGGPPAPAQPAPTPAPAVTPAAPSPPATVNNQTIRQVVRTSIGGNRFRVVLSNAFGTAPIDIGAA